MRPIKHIDFPHCIPTKQNEMKFDWSHRGCLTVIKFGGTSFSSWHFNLNNYAAIFMDIQFIHSYLYLTQPIP